MNTMENKLDASDEGVPLEEINAIQTDGTLKLDAHRGERLMGHCLAVGSYARKLLREMPLRPPAGLTVDDVEKLVFLAGACHDLGKATNKFQRYLYTDDKAQKEAMKADPLTRHALLGAFIAYALLVKSDLDRNLQATPLGRVLRFAPFWVIRRHHGNLLFPKQDLELRKADKELLVSQLADCPAAEMERILARIAEVGGFTPQPLISYAEVCARAGDLFEQFGDESLDVVPDLEHLQKHKAESLSSWLLLQQFFSVLLAADKSYAAVEIRRTINDWGLGPHWVKQYRARNFSAVATAGVNAWRAEVSHTAAATMDAAPIDASFFQLTLPTGLGKTLIALDCALRLRERLRETHRSARTIIYALPFLSVLEQAAGVYDDLVAFALNTETKTLPSELMIRHHHLAELRYVKGEKRETESEASRTDWREFSPNQSQLMIEGWRSALVMTSTVQLFQSLFAGRNRSTRKLHRLAGAIVVLDEVQSIPFKYWPLMRRAMRALNALFDTRFLLVTATQPRFLGDEGNQTVELVADYKTYFERLNRTVTTFDLALHTPAELAEIVLGKLNQEHQGQDALVIVNTIAAAVELFETLSDRLSTTHDVLHLSTNIIPAERARRIAQAKDRRHRTRPLFVVSTQLVEAGVDFSFPVLFRDFAPFSSLVQAAGRANRNGEYPIGNVYVYALKSEKGKRLADYIYDPVELDTTKRVLEQLPQRLDEAGLIQGIETYFREIQPQGTPQSQQVLKGAETLCFKPKSKGEREALETFRLIEDDETQEVFIEIDEHAAAAWRGYNDLYRQPLTAEASLEESFDRVGKLRAALIKCRPYMLSVPIKYFHDEARAAARKDEICRYARTEVSSVYDLTTGWKRITKENQ